MDEKRVTLRELSQYYYLKLEIEKIRDRYARLTTQALNPKIQSLNGMPSSGGVGDPTGEAAAQIADLISYHNKQLVRLEQELAKLEHFIGSIEDSRLRLIFSLRFIDCFSWWDVADYIGGNNTADSVKKMVYRYLKSCPTCPEQE